MIPKVSITFISMDTDDQLVTDTDTITTKMTGNAAYATPAPTLAADPGPGAIRHPHGGVTNPMPPRLSCIPARWRLPVGQDAGTT